MKIKLNSKLYDADGKEIINGNKPAMTIRDVIVSSILWSKENESKEDKMEKYSIFKKLKDAKTEVELKIEEIALIKKSVGEIQPPLIMGQCFDLLEDSGEETTSKAKK
jgi:hypothetical protein